MSNGAKKNNYNYEPTMSDLTENDSGMIPTKDMKVSTTFSPTIWVGLCDAAQRFDIQKSEIIRRAVTDALKGLK